MLQNAIKYSADIDLVEGPDGWRACRYSDKKDSRQTWPTPGMAKKALDEGRVSWQ